MTTFRKKGINEADKKKIIQKPEKTNKQTKKEIRREGNAMSKSTRT